MAKHKYKFKQVKDYLTDLGLLRFSGTYKHDETLIVPEFIKKMFTQSYRFPATYEVETAKQQCPQGACRSLGDIYRTVRHYYPEAKLSEVLKTLKQMLMNGEIGSIICPDVKCRVWGSWGGFAGTEDEFGFDYSDMKEYEGDEDFGKDNNLRKINL